MAGGFARKPAGAAAGGFARLDKWLWHARFFRTRSLAAGAVAAGHVRVNGVKVAKPAQPVRNGDTLTFAQGGRIRLVRVTFIGLRRGPAEVAQRLYLDLDVLPPDLPPAACPTLLEGTGDIPYLKPR